MTSPGSQDRSCCPPDLPSFDFRPPPEPWLVLEPDPSFILETCPLNWPPGVPNSRPSGANPEYGDLLNSVSPQFVFILSTLVAFVLFGTGAGISLLYFRKRRNAKAAQNNSSLATSSESMDQSSRWGCVPVMATDSRENTAANKAQTCEEDRYQHDTPPSTFHPTNLIRSCSISGLPEPVDPCSDPAPVYEEIGSRLSCNSSALGEHGKRCSLLLSQYQAGLNCSPYSSHSSTCCPHHSAVTLQQCQRHTLTTCASVGNCDGPHRHVAQHTCQHYLPQTQATQCCCQAKSVGTLPATVVNGKPLNGPKSRSTSRGRGSAPRLFRPQRKSKDDLVSRSASGPRRKGNKALPRPPLLKVPGSHPRPREPIIDSSPNLPQNVLVSPNMQTNSHSCSPESSGSDSKTGPKYLSPNSALNRKHCITLPGLGLIEPTPSYSASSSEQTLNSGSGDSAGSGENIGLEYTSRSFVGRDMLNDRATGKVEQQQQQQQQHIDPHRMEMQLFYAQQGPSTSHCTQHNVAPYCSSQCGHRHMACNTAQHNAGSAYASDSVLCSDTKCCATGVSQHTCYNHAQSQLSSGDQLVHYGYCALACDNSHPSPRQCGNTFHCTSRTLHHPRKSPGTQRRLLSKPHTDMPPVMTSSYHEPWPTDPSNQFDASAICGLAGQTVLASDSGNGYCMYGVHDGNMNSSGSTVANGRGGRESGYGTDNALTLAACGKAAMNHHGPELSKMTNPAHLAQNRPNITVPGATARHDSISEVREPVVGEKNRFAAAAELMSSKPVNFLKTIVGGANSSMGQPRLEPGKLAGIEWPLNGLLAGVTGKINDKQLEQSRKAQNPPMMVYAKDNRDSNKSAFV